MVQGAWACKGRGCDREQVSDRPHVDRDIQEAYQWKVWIPFSQIHLPNHPIHQVRAPVFKKQENDRHGGTEEVGSVSLTSVVGVSRGVVDLPGGMGDGCGGRASEEDGRDGDGGQGGQRYREHLGRIDGAVRTCD